MQHNSFSLIGVFLCSLTLVVASTSPVDAFTVTLGSGERYKLTVQKGSYFENRDVIRESPWYQNIDLAKDIAQYVAGEWETFEAEAGWQLFNVGNARATFAVTPGSGVHAESIIVRTLLDENGNTFCDNESYPGFCDNVSADWGVVNFGPIHPRENYNSIYDGGQPLYNFEHIYWVSGEKIEPLTNVPTPTAILPSLLGLGLNISKRYRKVFWDKLQK